MVRPCGARDFVDPGDAVLHQCIRPLIGACAPGPHGYQRACDLISGPASNGAVWVTSVRTRWEDRSSIVVSSSRRARRGKGIDYVIDSLLVLRCSFVRAWRPFLRPDLRVQRCAARRDRQGWPSRLPCLSRQRCHALTGPSTARGSSRSGRIGLDALKGAAVVENRSGNAGQLVGERDRQHVAVQALLGGLDPGFEAIAFPLLWLDLDQHHPGGLNKQLA